MWTESGFRTSRSTQASRAPSSTASSPTARRSCSTRPNSSIRSSRIVYRFFPNRQAILLDLIEEFGRVVGERVEGALEPNGLDDVQALLARIFDGICDTIEEQGAGVWRLLNSAGPDPEIESVAQKVRAEIAGPWFARVQEVTRAPARQAFALTSMIAATIPAVVELWISDQVERDEAVTYLERGVASLIREFTTDLSSS